MNDRIDVRTDKEKNHDRTKHWLKGIYLLVMVIAGLVLFSGCAGMENYLEKGEDLLDQTQDISREIEKTGRSAQRLKRQRSCFEIKNASKEYNAKVRIVGSDRSEMLSSTEYVRFKSKAERFADEQIINFDLEIYNADGEYLYPASQQVENRFRRYQISDRGCGILYFVAEDQRITGLQQPQRTRLY